MRLESLRYRHRHEEADEHQGQEQQTDRYGLGIQFVGGPGRVVPRLVHREKSYQGLQDAGPRQVLEQEVGDLRDREYEHEVVEELEGRRPLAHPLSQSPPHVSHESSLTTFGTFCPARDSQDQTRAELGLSSNHPIRERKCTSVLHPFATSVNMIR